MQRGEGGVIASAGTDTQRAERVWRIADVPGETVLAGQVPG